MPDVSDPPGTRGPRDTHDLREPPDLREWVERHIVPWLPTAPGTYWCPRWWHHPTAVLRLNRQRENGGVVGSR
jgi:hypothetical protein